MPHCNDHGTQGCTVGLLAEPEAPTKLANRLARTLPNRLADGNTNSPRADVDVVSEPFTAGTEDASTLLDRIEDRARGRDWDVVIGLTELPLHANRRYVVAEVNTRTRSVLVSLPALGGLRLHSASVRVMSQLVAELTARGDNRRGDIGSTAADLEDAVISPLSSIRGESQTGSAEANFRFVARGLRGRLRLLAGMVRTNQPWKLVPGLSKALAAALGIGAIATVNSTIWALSSSLTITRLAIAMMGSIAMMVSWLIVDANLWHRRAEDESPEAKEKRALYNASTVLTVACGSLICYAALYIINLLSALFIVNGQAFQQLVGHPMSSTQHFTLSWLVASMATVAGALGSGLESEEAVRAAAFGKREQERRRLLEEGDQSRATSD